MSESNKNGSREQPGISTAVNQDGFDGHCTELDLNQNVKIISSNANGKDITDKCKESVLVGEIADNKPDGSLNVLDQVKNKNVNDKSINIVIFSNSIPEVLNIRNINNKQLI